MAPGFCICDALLTTAPTTVLVRCGMMSPQSLLAILRVVREAVLISFAHHRCPALIHADLHPHDGSYTGLAGHPNAISSRISGISLPDR